MIIDQTTIDILKARYGVFDIESRYEPTYTYDAVNCTYRAMGVMAGGEIKMHLAHSGFERLLRDLFAVEKTVVDTRDIFSITPMEIQSDGKVVYVAKYPMDKYPLDVIAAYGEKLREALEAEGCKVILMPKIMDVSILTVEQLTQMRDALTELIQNLSYDNIIGF